MARSIYFITHPDVVIDPTVPVPQWPLSARGRSRMQRLLSQNWLRHVDAFLARPSEIVRGWECAEAAQARIVRAVTHITRAAPGSGPLAVVSHGGVGTLLLCHLKGQPISRTAEQPGRSGGNYFLFHWPEGTLSHGWRPI